MRVARRKAHVEEHEVPVHVGGIGQRRTVRSRAERLDEAPRAGERLGVGGARSERREFLLVSDDGRGNHVGGVLKTLELDLRHVGLNQAERRRLDRRPERRVEPGDVSHEITERVRVLPAREQSHR